MGLQRERVKCASPSVDDVVVLTSFPWSLVLAMPPRFEDIARVFDPPVDTRTPDFSDFAPDAGAGCAPVFVSSPTGSITVRAFHPPASVAVLASDPFFHGFLLTFSAAR